MTAVCHIQGSGLKPTLYIIMESDLQPKSANNMLFKYAADSNLAVPEHTCRGLCSYKATVPSEQYDNEAKTKEVVFQRPRPKRLHMNPALDGVELVEYAKLLGVILMENVSVEMHVNCHCVVKKLSLDEAS